MDGIGHRLDVLDPAIGGEAVAAAEHVGAAGGDVAHQFSHFGFHLKRRSRAESVHVHIADQAKTISKAAFERAAAAAKAGCPVSKLYKTNITLDATLEN